MNHDMKSKILEVATTMTDRDFYHLVYNFLIESDCNESASLSGDWIGHACERIQNILFEIHEQPIVYDELRDFSYIIEREE